MTALFLHHLNGHDRVAVKPHAAPVFHAIQYLMGNLDRSYLTTLRSKGGLQSYPLQDKRPDLVDFSTGSVGLGPAAPLFAAATRRYVDAHFGDRPPRATSPWSVTPNSMKATSGRRSPIRPPRVWATSCGWSTSIGNRWIEWFRGCASSNGPDTSSPPAGTSSNSNTARNCAAPSRCPVAMRSGHG